MSGTLISAIERVLYREAMYLDTGNWDGWLGLFTEDCIFWMPAWRDEATPTEDPDSELSLIYYRGRRNLEDRVWRVKSGRSVASLPRPRVVHMISNVLVEEQGDNTALAHANFTTHLYDARAQRTHAFFGRYEHQLTKEETVWRISSKKILLLNDTIPTVVDFYLI